jgi:hypothetical protein
MEANVVIVSPHLDDAVFSCWHVLEAERAVSVVNVFAGVPPPDTPLPRWDRITGASDPAARVRERIDEDRLALGLAGGEPANLPFVEAQYREETPTLDELLPAIREHVSGDEDVFVPAGIGGHSAHCLLRNAGPRSSRRRCLGLVLRRHPVRHGVRLAGLGLGDRARALPERRRGVERRARAGRGCGLEPRVVPLDDDAQRRKIAAMRTYRTQFAALEAGGQTAPDASRADRRRGRLVPPGFLATLAPGGVPERTNGAVLKTVSP